MRAIRRWRAITGAIAQAIRARCETQTDRQHVPQAKSAALRLEPSARVGSRFEG
jgi:hypothetical protein